jgi:Nuclease A inhibitor-like protein
VHTKPTLFITALSLVLLACNSDPGTTTSGEASTTQSEPASTGETVAALTESTGEDTPTSTGETGVADTSTGAPGTSTGTSAGDDSTSTGGVVNTDTGESTSDASTGDESSSSTGDDGGLGADAQEVVDQLEDAVEGVLYLSESDYPWTVVAFADGAPVTEDNLKALIADVYVPHEGQETLEERVIEVRTLAQLMDPLTVPKDWWGDYEIMQAAQYTKIREVLETGLTNIQVFRLGKQSGNNLIGAIDVYVLGQTADGDVVGMWSVSVET